MHVRRYSVKNLILAHACNTSLVGIQFSTLELGPILPLYLSFCIITQGRKISRLLPPPTYVYTAEAIPPPSPFLLPRPGVNLHSLRATALALPNKEEEEEKTYPKRGGKWEINLGIRVGEGVPPASYTCNDTGCRKEFGIEGWAFFSSVEPPPKKKK